MSATAAVEGPALAKKGGGKKKLLMIMGGVLLLVGVGGWFSGIIPGLLGGKKEEAHAEAAHGDAAHAAPEHVFMDLPDNPSLYAPIPGGRRENKAIVVARAISALRAALGP